MFGKCVKDGSNLNRRADVLRFVFYSLVRVRERETNYAYNRFSMKVFSEPSFEDDSGKF